MDVGKFVDIINSDFYVGVPDSQLKPLCDFLMYKYGIDKNRHVIAANEGNCVAMAAGYYLATGKIPVVYMQNSGEGNIVNPVTSLLNDKVYAIPMIFIIGWRGEPGKTDEPQHIFQGEVTIKLLDVLGINSFVISEDTKETDVVCAMECFREKLKEGKSVAFVIKKGALSSKETVRYCNDFDINREEAIAYISKIADKDLIVSTTGKISRELFEIREVRKQGHQYDFLTVGSMGHSSSIALGIAVNKPKTKVWCIDGDGAVLMHMGAMAVIGAVKPNNLVHIVINNEAHETVGGMPTVSSNVKMTEVAKACGYLDAVKVATYEELGKALDKAKKMQGLCFIEIMCELDSRKDLGRPTKAPIENKKAFMKYLETCD